jgi:hypothetical protein
MVRRVVAVIVAMSALVLASPVAARAAPPVCGGGVFPVLPNTPVTLPACTEASPPITLTFQQGFQPIMGEVTVGDPLVWKPKDGAHGIETLRYTVTNADGVSNVTEVRIIVNTPPTCQSGTATTTVGTPLTIAKLPCADADADLLRDPALSDPAHGALTVGDDSSVIYTPTPGYVGPDSFTYGFRDSFLGISNSGTMSITVTGQPAAAVPTPTPTPTTSAPVVVPSKDTTAPVVTLKNASKKQAVSIAVTTNESATATLTLALDKATARKLKLKSRTIGTAKATLQPGTSKLKVKLSTKAAKKLKTLKQAKLTVTAVVTDAAGNTATKTLAVTVKQK